jgi:septal ring factor EnvC (AmiA/AmiB activator)
VLAASASEQQQQQQTCTVETARCERDAKAARDQTERLEGVLGNLKRDGTSLQHQVEECETRVVDFEVRGAVDHFWRTRWTPCDTVMGPSGCCCS